MKKSDDRTMAEVMTSFIKMKLEQAKKWEKLLKKLEKKP